MVRTSGGIRISAGKSSKKSGGGGSGGGSRSVPASSGKSTGSSRLPPIPHCEAPPWQKPITNFFNSDAGPSKNKDVEVIQNEQNIEASTQKEDSTDKNINSDNTEEVKATADSPICEKNNTEDDEQPPTKSKKEEEIDKENVDGNISN